MENFIVGLICVILAVWLSIAVANTIWRVEAVEYGKAEFYLDKNHNRQWRWLP
jgi:uncharacterized membrane protein